MKLQHLAIIFVIIILPISLVMSSYIQSQIDTINLQTTYNTKLQTATYDAIKAFQLNTINNKYSTVSDSKIRDIEASISTFYDSLGSVLGASGYTDEDLQQFIPAIVYTMYDGYYIYGKYYNYNKEEYQYGLKPYIYYSCRYVKGTSDDFVVNYTLDNNITVYGKVNGNYVTKSGTLINPDAVNIISDKLVVYGTDSNKVNIEPEILKEQLVIVENVDDNENVNETKISRDYYEYVTYSNKKVYYDGNQYFWYTNNMKQEINDKNTLEYVGKWTYDGHLHSNSAIEYFTKAKSFSQWVNENMKGITQINAREVDGTPITDFAVNTDREEIFDLSRKNDPLLDSSTFNQNRISVIRKTIQSTLNTAIANYSSNAEYEFALPIFTEEDWDKLENNIAVASFMQGIPIGSKYYNNYCIITNNKNKELVTKDSIYVITQNTDNADISDHSNDTHKVASIELLEQLDKGTQILGAYKNIDFELQTVVAEGKEVYYYPHANNRCYNCMVNVAQTYNLDDIIKGEVKSYNKNTDEYDQKERIDNLNNLRKVYLTALAREKYDLYKTNNYFGA